MDFAAEAAANCSVAELMQGFYNDQSEIQQKQIVGG